MESPSRQVAADLDLLTAERERIKASLMAEHGPRIERMMAEASGAKPPTAQEERHARMMRLLNERTPLRAEVKQAQADALEKLVAASREGAERGEDVGQRLDMLLQLQAEGKPAATPVKDAAVAN